jgi:outer membrane protein assembly factor BamB
MSPRKPLRLWPGVVLATLLVVFRLAAPIIGLGGPATFFLGGLAGGLLILVWWLFFSRALWSERLAAIALMIIALFVTSRFLHVSIDGRLFVILATPLVSLALVVWALATSRLSDSLRRASMVATILIASGAWTLMRVDGITGDGVSALRWRWSQTPEERLLAAAPEKVRTPLPEQATPETPKAATAPAIESTAPKSNTEPPTMSERTVARVEERDLARVEWPGFRGPARDGVIRGVSIAIDWAKSPPVELWRRPIGPGWSSFAVHGDRLYTQEQRGDDEIVSCYNARTGEPIWQHRDAARFWESAGGAGPRATPTVSNGRVFSLGATGILNALDANNGGVLWSRNATADTGAANPGWGFAGSPLVVNDLVIVATSGRLVAYDVATGTQRWLGPTGGLGYSSPHLVTIDGVAQIVLLRGSRTISVAPADGTLLWDHTWQPAAGFLQPAVATDGDLLITEGEGMGGIGMRRIAVARGAAGWTATERWTSRGLKPYFSDFVVHKGHAFGFDGSILACIDLANGERKWKGGRYGHGQMVLLRDQDVLLVLSEEGELALVKATPDQFTELARFKAIEGKTWNHPVLVGDVLLVRNAEEMAAFRLSLAGR